MEFRAVCFSIAVFALFLSLGQQTHACATSNYLTRKDFAAADIVIEGQVRYLHPTLTEVTRDGKIREQATGLDITFIVDEVIRGKLEKSQIRVGWVHGTFGYPESFEKFHKRYGKEVRVGLISPESMVENCDVFRIRRIRRATKDGYVYENSKTR